MFSTTDAQGQAKKEYVVNTAEEKSVVSSVISTIAPHTVPWLLAVQQMSILHKYTVIYIHTGVSVLSLQCEAVAYRNRKTVDDKVDAR